jgi:heme/copper-type cytochrome/quinol oxidase subunit 3
MWKGMLGLFVVCGCIMLLIMLIKKIVKKREPPQIENK